MIGHKLWKLIFSPLPKQNVQNVANIYNTNTLFSLNSWDLRVKERKCIEIRSKKGEERRRRGGVVLYDIRQKSSVTVSLLSAVIRSQCLDFCLMAFCFILFCIFFPWPMTSIRFPLCLSWMGEKLMMVEWSRKKGIEF